MAHSVNTTCLKNRSHTTRPGNKSKWISYNSRMSSILYKHVIKNRAAVIIVILNSGHKWLLAQATYDGVNMPPSRGEGRPVVLKTDANRTHIMTRAEYFDCGRATCESQHLRRRTTQILTNGAPQSLRSFCSFRRNRKEP